MRGRVVLFWWSDRRHHLHSPAYADRRAPSPRRCHPPENASEAASTVAGGSGPQTRGCAEGRRAAPHRGRCIPRRRPAPHCIASARRSKWGATSGPRQSPKRPAPSWGRSGSARDSPRCRRPGPARTATLPLPRCPWSRSCEEARAFAISRVCSGTRLELAILLSSASGQALRARIRQGKVLSQKRAPVLLVDML